MRFADGLFKGVVDAQSHSNFYEVRASLCIHCRLQCIRRYQEGLTPMHVRQSCYLRWVSYHLTPECKRSGRDARYRIILID